MFTINQYIQKVYDNYDPRINTVEEAISNTIYKYPDMRDSNLDIKIRAILKDCKDIADFIRIQKAVESDKDINCRLNCPYKGGRVF